MTVTANWAKKSICRLALILKDPINNNHATLITGNTNS